MPFLKYDNVTIHYEEYGAGYPLLMFSGGSLNSSIEAWRTLTAFDPRVEYANDFRMIALDIRNAGESWAPITEQDGWHSYTADHIALLDHLGIERCHVLGHCIGPSFSLALMEAQPWRVSAAVHATPSGRYGPFKGRRPSFQNWVSTFKNHPEATETVLDQFAANLYKRDFIPSTTREFVQSCQTPMFVLPGIDQYHPTEIGEELARLAPNAECMKEWLRDPSQDIDGRHIALPAAVTRIREFLLKHTPPGQVRA